MPRLYELWLTSGENPLVAFNSKHYTSFEAKWKQDSAYRNDIVSPNAGPPLNAPRVDTTPGRTIRPCAQPNRQHKQQGCRGAPSYVRRHRR